MIKYVNEESTWESYTTDNKPFNWFAPSEDEDNMDFVKADNYEGSMNNIIWTKWDEIIEAIDSRTFELWKVDSKVQELVLPDWRFDFDSYRDWLENFPVELKKEIDDYVYREYPELINFDPSEINSKIEELTYSDWTFDFMSYEDWLQQFPPKLEERIRKYVSKEYKKFFCDSEDEIGWTVPMESADNFDHNESIISNKTRRHWNRGYRQKGRPQYNELNDILAA